MVFSLKLVECAVDACPKCENEVPAIEPPASPDGWCPQCGQSLWCRKRIIDCVVVLEVLPHGQAGYHDVIGLFESLSESTPQIVVDLSRVEYSTSGFVAGLVGLAKRARTSAGRLVLCGLRPVICEILARTQLDKFFDICDNQEGALRACRCRASNRSGD